MLVFFQFGMFETMASSVVDLYPNYLRKNKFWYTIGVCLLEFLVGIVFVTRVSTVVHFKHYFQMD